MKNVAARLALLLVFSSVLLGCDGKAPECPPQPVSLNAGPVAPMAGQSSIEIELSASYVRERIRKMFEPGPADTSGAFLHQIDFVDVARPGGGRNGTIVLRLEPWIRGQDGRPVSLNRNYRLTLELSPHIITPASIPDQAERRLLLCGNQAGCSVDTGAVITFDLGELYNLAFNRPACQTPDPIDEKIVPAVYGKLSTQKPLSLPVKPIAALIAGASSTTPMLTDVNVACDGFLKLGLAFNVGTTHAFDRASMILSRYANCDWLIDIDKSIMVALVRSRVSTELTKAAPGSTLTSFSAAFVPGAIRVIAAASITVPALCGGLATVAIDATTRLWLCDDANGTSILLNHIETNQTTPNVCVLVSNFFSWFNVGRVGELRSEWPKVADLEFDVGPNDMFYGTTLDTDNVFTIAGRSTMMDAKATADGHPRPGIVPCSQVP